MSTVIFYNIIIMLHRVISVMPCLSISVLFVNIIFKGFTICKAMDTRIHHIALSPFLALFEGISQPHIMVLANSNHNNH